MTTEAKNQANQANAQHSTGPRTEAGKAIASRNATKHGLTAETPLLPGEDPVVYQCLAAGMLDDFQPLNTTETDMVLELVDIRWRQRRASRYEFRILSSESPNLKDLNNVSLCAARLKRQYSATLKELQQMHRENKKVRDQQLEAAILIHKADGILKRPSTIAACGFDFTPDDLENRVAFEQHLKNAQEIVDDYDDDLDSESLDQPDDEFADAA